VTRKETEACLEAAPDLQWRLIIALARFGGLRTPSELVRLRWTDVLWDKERIVVHSPKTEGYEGKETRVVPLFPELKTLLNEAWEAEAENSEFVITRYRNDSQNLRTTLLKIIERAGHDAMAEVVPEHACQQADRAGGSVSDSCRLQMDGQQPKSRTEALSSSDGFAL
jgi:integrase